MTRYVIRGFADGETERIWNEQRSRRFPARIQQRALNKLALLNRAARIEDLRVPPGNRLEALRGRRVGQYSIRINTSGGCVFAGKPGMLLTWRFATITEL